MTYTSSSMSALTYALGKSACSTSLPAAAAIAKSSLTVGIRVETCECHALHGEFKQQPNHLTDRFQVMKNLFTFKSFCFLFQIVK